MRSTRKRMEHGENRSMADLTCKLEHQNFFCKNFSSQGTCVSNSMTLTVTQPKIRISFENSGHMGPVALTGMQKRRRRRRRRRI